MDSFLKQQFYIWTYEKIKSNPKVYGGDSGNSLIMKAYIQEFHNDEKANNLSDTVFSFLSTVSRIKNKLLENNPQFDFRVKHRGKKSPSIG